MSFKRWGAGSVKTTVIAGVVLVILAGAAGCGGTELESRWRQRDIAVDGTSAEWDGAMVVVEETNLGVGIQNDDEYLYLCLVASDRHDQMQILAGGLTLWIDPEGGENKTLGIRYPGGAGLAGGAPRAPGSQRLPAPGERGDPPSLDSLLVRLAPPERLEIRNAEGELVESLALDAAAGLEARVGNEGGALVCELKIPLLPSSEHPFAVGASDGRIGLGLETPEMERPQRENPEGMKSGGGRGGGGRGGGGRGGGGSRGDMGGMRPEMPEPINLWGTVILASGTEAVPESDTAATGGD